MINGMSLIHRTTLTPTKVELLAAWLPEQPWYRGAGAPALAKVDGFRLDDPENVVGIEFFVAADGDVRYHVPMTYRSEPLDGGESALIGTTEHGVLGTRHVYDGTRDPVLVQTLIALFNGEVEPQMQSVSHTVDPDITVTYDGGRIEPATPSADGGDLRLRPDLVLHFRRCLSDPVPEHVGAVHSGSGPLVLLLS
jgi:hypothetical protein